VDPGTARNGWRLDTSESPNGRADQAARATDVAIAVPGQAEEEASPAQVGPAQAGPAQVGPAQQGRHR
jgi:hypothetical protein